MFKKEFVEKVGTVLQDPPHRAVKSEMSLLFGLFRKTNSLTVTLSKDIIKDYATYIVKNFEGFEESEKSQVFYKTLYQTEYDESAYRYKRAVVQDDTLYSLTDQKESIQAAMDRAKNEETFSDMLVRFQRDCGLSGPKLYHAAGIDYKHFSKIISDRHYKPSKATALALAIALKLGIDETVEFLGKAGLALNPSDMFDMTVKYFIQSGCYDRTTIDMLMDSFGLQLLPQNW